MDRTTHLAIDIGASNGRFILGWPENGKLCTKEMHRFPNEMKRIGKNLCWDTDALFAEIITGLKKCAQSGCIPSSVGIDTWGVDFVLLDKDGNKTGPAVAYRDDRTNGMDIEVGKLISDSGLYSRAGIQKMPINTIYQLMAVKKNTPEQLDNAAYLLFMPDYLHYRLCGVIKNEYTIASTSGLLNAEAKTWDEEIISLCGFPRRIFNEIVPAGTLLGGFTDEIKEAAGFDCKVIMPPSHDTASAFLAVPTKTSCSVYISSGTWSLMGVELTDPVTSEASRIANFTNEGGFGFRYRFLKNIAGLWLIQSVHKEIGNGISYDDMVLLARESGNDSIIDVNDESLTAPDSMTEAICAACIKSDQSVPENLGDFARCIYRSLAGSYADTIKQLQQLTGTDYDSINIIGGGSLNEYLNQLTAASCGLPVYAGPSEGTALGNIVAQMIALGIFPDHKAAREVIRRSFEIKEFV